MSPFINFFAETILFFYSIFGNLGWAIIVFTILLRLLVLPLTLPSIKSSQKIRELQPELKKLKEKYKGNQQGYVLAQSQLYKAYNINPLAGCLPQLLQFAILIILYQTIIGLFSGSRGELNFHFFWLNLSQPDGKFIAPILAGVTQFFLSLMLSPATQTRDIVPNKAKDSLIKEANVQEENIAEMASTMQQQMIFLMPVMTAFIALRLPSGLALYWIVGTVISIVTQYFVSGWGGLAVYWNKYLAGKGFLKAIKLPDSTQLAALQPGEKQVIKVSHQPLLKNPLQKSVTAQSQTLATALSQLGGSSERVKPKNLKATKVKKNIKKLRASSKQARKQRRKHR